MEYLAGKFVSFLTTLVRVVASRSEGRRRVKTTQPFWIDNAWCFLAGGWARTRVDLPGAAAAEDVPRLLPSDPEADRHGDDRGEDKKQTGERVALPLGQGRRFKPSQVSVITQEKDALIPSRSPNLPSIAVTVKQ